MGKYAFGVDVGGTTVKIGLFDQKGTILDKWEIPTNTSNGGENILPDIAKAIEGKCKEKEIEKLNVLGIGIGVPGPVDASGVVRGAVNLGWDTVNLPQIMYSLTEIQTKAGNDANVAALGEMWKGGGIGHKNLVAVTLGTGVGGGIIVDGRILAGASGAGGEIGHMHIEDDETVACNCGQKGCLEQYTSATGIVSIANKVLSKSDKPSVLRNEKVTAKTVFDGVKAGDDLAVETAEQFGSYLGKGLALIAAVVNPEIFVIGGGVSNAGEVLFDYIKKNFDKYVFKGCKNVEFSLATLGNDAGICGAVRMVLE